MRLLAIDTCLEDCSVAVANDPRAAVFVTETVGRRHGERLFALLSAAMDEADLSFTDLDRIAVTVGPGSFTGIRVGIAAARGLALVAACPVVGIGSLAAIAGAARDAAGAVAVLAAIDARRGAFYGQPFAADGTAEAPPSVGPGEDFRAICSGHRLAGPGAAALAAALGLPGETVVSAATGMDIAAVLRLGRAAPAERAPQPLYLRPPDAKPQQAALARR